MNSLLFYVAWDSQKEHCLNVQTHWSGFSRIFLEWVISRYVCVGFSANMNYVNFNVYEITIAIAFAIREETSNSINLPNLKMYQD